MRIRARIAAALKAVGIASNARDGETLFCVGASAGIAVTVMKRAGITQENLAADQTAVGAWFGVIAAEYLVERLGASFDEIARGVVPAIVMRWLPPGLPDTLAEEVRARAAPLTAQVMEIYTQDRRTARVVGQVIGAWLAQSDPTRLEQLARLFEKARERLRVVEKGGNGNGAEARARARVGDSDDAEEAALLDPSDPAVQAMIKTARARGYVTLEQLNAVLPSQEVSPAQMEEMMSVLSDMASLLSRAKRAHQSRRGRRAVGRRMALPTRSRHRAQDSRSKRTGAKRRSKIVARSSCRCFREQRSSPCRRYSPAATGYASPSMK